MRIAYNTLLVILLILLPGAVAHATHFYGVDLFYTHVSGNTYKVSFVAYGDCTGQQFPSFKVVRPQIHIYKNGTEVNTDFLDLEPPKDGIEVTPVCPAEKGNTTCVNPNGVVPGVTKFVYSKEFTLDGPAKEWRFSYIGESDGNAQGGRSLSLTNVTEPGVISLDATLDNTEANNSSPEYTTIATPFYCVNKATNFNPGAVDADGDSLLYELVDAKNILALLPYLPGYSAANPLSTAAGSYSFSNKTGQLSFTPDILQRSLVVYKVSEFRKGVLLGTSMREMTVVVLNCDNNPPAGFITDVVGGAALSGTVVSTCEGSKNISFDIDPGDIDGHNITMEVNGLPKNATLTISNNGTKTPTSHFSWDILTVPGGNYTFYITYTDDGCRIASRQTQAYTINIVPQDLYANVVAAKCRARGLATLHLPDGAWDVLLYRNNVRVGNMQITGAYTDSLQPGNYKAVATNALGCTAETDFEIPTNCDIVDIPSAFSPNGDGKNDVLYVAGTENVKELYLRIYNRWGQLVFETNDKNKGWDGSYQGQKQPIETYGYVLTGIFHSGGVFQKQGNITMLR